MTSIRLWSDEEWIAVTDGYEDYQPRTGKEATHVRRARKVVQKHNDAAVKTTETRKRRERYLRSAVRLIRCERNLGKREP